MKSIKLIFQYLITAIIILNISCKKNFGEINTNPQIIETPDIRLLLTYSQEKMERYQNTEWIWESMEQLHRYTQYISTDPFEMSDNVNTRYSNYYLNILPNLYEIRRQIFLKLDKENYKKMNVVTYVLQVLHGLKVTDLNGSMPYSDAIKGRDSLNFSPRFDSQELLFDTWLQQLNDAINVLSDNISTTQISYGNADIFFKSNWTKWIKLANSLKLRIAVRVENADVNKAKQIFTEVLQNSFGAIVNLEDQLEYQSLDYLPFGTRGDINYRSHRHASASIISFLKKTNDPRLRIYFEPNDINSGFSDSLTKYGVSPPSFIDLSDKLLLYQGGPTDLSTNSELAKYNKNAFAVGPVAKYFLISRINRKFFSPKFNSPTSIGQFKDIIISAAEICLLLAEFIEKGYANAVNTNGDAEYWYKKGITSSIASMNDIAVIANSTIGYSGNGSTEINAYLQNVDIALNDSNNLERIYIQQYLNFYRSANDAFVLCRRTGYPKNNSNYYKREIFNETIPRRFWIKDPGEINRTNWQAAMKLQGFTEGAKDVQTLSTQRVWYDKNSPSFGMGN